MTSPSFDDVIHSLSRYLRWMDIGRSIDKAAHIQIMLCDYDCQLPWCFDRADDRVMADGRDDLIGLGTS